MFLVGSSSCFKHTNYISGVKYNPVGFGRFPTVKPFIKNTSEEFIKCRLDNFSMSFILYYGQFQYLRK